MPAVAPRPIGEGEVLPLEVPGGRVLRKPLERPQSLEAEEFVEPDADEENPRAPAWFLDGAALRGLKRLLEGACHAQHVAFLGADHHVARHEVPTLARGAIDMAAQGFHALIAPDVPVRKARMPVGERAGPAPVRRALGELPDPETRPPARMETVRS